MAPSAAAITTLKAGLLRQFGATAQGAIDYEVDSRVAARGGRLSREDLDEIEHGVLAAVRQKRKTLTKSAKSEASLAATAPLPSSQAIRPPSNTGTPGPAPPSGGGTKRPVALSKGAGSALGKAASESRLPAGPLLMPVTGSLTATAPNAQRMAPVPPFGLSLTKDYDLEDRSGGVKPKYEVPLPQKLKPIDHWDLIVAFDTNLFKREEAERYRFNRSGGFLARKADLDKQVAERKIAKEKQSEAIRLEREECRAQVKEDAKMKEQERKDEWAKREAQRKNNEAMEQELNAKRDRAAQKKKQECQEILSWLQNEKGRKAEERRLQQIEYARKCEFAQEAFKAARAEKQRKKLEEQEREMEAVAEAKRFLDEAEAKNRAAVAKRESRVAAIAGSLGADVAQRDAEEERKLQEKIARVLAEQDRRIAEDARNRKETKDRLIREMLDSLDQQIADRDKHKLEEKEADRKQVEIFRKQLEEQNEKKRREAEQAKKDREELDQALINQMRGNVSVHKGNFGLTGDIQRQELAFNRLIFEHMSAENFCPEFTEQILEAAHDRGKLTFFPSVGPSTEPIHPLELQVPDV
mmetsp:Transcript_68244/g.163760  ORF Transcript_68244/g.163760 Transcript_68244/m.163760 type:complete len:582 (-) Transcript_68244:83-1828(-)